MITLTKAAAEQVKKSAQESNLEGMALRLAVKRMEDGSLDYGMGFDSETEDDLRFKSEGVDVVVAPPYMELLNGMTVDFVELDAGSYNFIFLNPNDPNYSPPAE